MKIERKEVQSSNIKSVGYNADSKKLEVEFTNGSIYQYFSVPDEVYEEFSKSASMGAYHSSEIAKKYKYNCTFKPKKEDEEKEENKKSGPSLSELKNRILNSLGMDRK